MMELLQVSMPTFPYKLRHKNEMIEVAIKLATIVSHKFISDPALFDKPLDYTNF